MKTTAKFITTTVILFCVCFSSGCLVPVQPTTAPNISLQTPSLTWTATTSRTPTSTPQIEEPIQTKTPQPDPTPIPALQPGQLITLTGIKMMDEKNSWGIESGGHAVHTEDGGRTWQDASPYQNKALYFFLDANHAWAFPMGLTGCMDSVKCSYTESTQVIYRTTDQGRHWEARQPVQFDSSNIIPIAIQFIDDNTGWFLFVNSYGMSGAVTSSLARSQDGGLTWKYLGTATYPCLPTGMVFVDRNTGWIASDCRWAYASEIHPLEDFLSGNVSPTLHVTGNGGEDWSTSNDLPPPDVYPYPEALKSPGKDSPDGVKCGVEEMESNAPQVIHLKWGCSLGYYTRTDFSYSYLTLLDVQPWHSWLSNVDEFILNEFYGWRLVPSGTSQPNRIEWTANGGRTWVIYHYVTWDTAEFDFINKDIGWAIVTIGDQTALVYTTDTGDSWQELIPVISD